MWDHRQHDSRKFAARMDESPTETATNDCDHAPLSLHIITKNLQSIQSESRFQDFCINLSQCEYDIFFFNETWRHDREERFVLPTMGRIFLSGGNSNQGVGIAISGRMMKQFSNISFHAYFPRLCFVELDLFWTHFFPFVMLFANFLG